MSRPAINNVKIAVTHPDVHNKAAVNGDTITVYADGAIYDETAGKFIHVDQTKRNK